MAFSRISVQQDSLERGTSRLTVIVVGGVDLETPGLSKHLTADPSTSVVRCAAISGDIFSICQRFTPCVLVADVELPSYLNPAKFAIATDSGRSIKTLIVVDEDDPKLCQKLLKMGFDGVIERSAPAAVFQRALDSVTQGELWASRKSISALVRGFLSDSSPKKLTAREREIFDLLARGYKNQEIAEALFVSRDTVRWHLRSVYAKLGVPDRKRAIEYALGQTRTVSIKPNAIEGVGKRPQRTCS